MKRKIIFNQTSSSFLSLQTPVILSKVYPELAEGKDRVFSQGNLQCYTPVIQSLSKDGGFIEDNLRRIPSHFDKLSVT